MVDAAIGVVGSTALARGRQRLGAAVEGSGHYCQNLEFLDGGSAMALALPRDDRWRWHRAESSQQVAPGGSSQVLGPLGWVQRL
jgi:hypothetical protein